jgi:hypothetical protein
MLVRFLNNGNVATGKSTGHATVATTDVVESVNQIHTFLCVLNPKQISRSELIIHLFPSPR